MCSRDSTGTRRAVESFTRCSVSRDSTKTQARPTLQAGTTQARAMRCKVLGWTLSSDAASFRSRVRMAQVAGRSQEKGPAISRIPSM